MTKPDCYKCVFRKDLVGDAHSACSNFTAKVEGDPHGKKNGWFMHPWNFDPTWLLKCNGFKKK